MALPISYLFFHVTCSSTLNREAASFYGTFVPSHQTGEPYIAEDHRHVKHEVAQAIFQDGHVRGLNLGPFKQETKLATFRVGVALLSF